MLRVQNDAYMPHSIEYARCGLAYINTNSITFLLLICNEIFPQMFSMPRRNNLTKNFLGYKVW